MRILKRALSLLLVIACLTAFLPVSTHAVESMQEKNERIDLRDETSKTYAMPDGSFETRISSAPIHFMDESRTYQDIKSNLIANTARLATGEYRFRNEANAIVLRFGDLDGESFPVRLEKGDVSVSIRPLGGNTARAELINALPKESPLNAYAQGDNCVTYAEVFPGVDIVYISKYGGVKENIVLSSPQAATVFHFELALEGLTIKQDGENFWLLNDDGEAVFQLGDLFATDSTPEGKGGPFEGRVAAEVMVEGDRVLLTLTPDEAFLKEPSLQWPIVIDPTFIVTSGTQTYDTFIGSKEPTRNFNSGTNMPYIRTGRDDAYGSRRGMIRFTLPTHISAAQITDAKLRLKYYSGVAPTTAKAYMLKRDEGLWDSNTVTWNTGSTIPTYFPTATFSSAGDNWYQTNITSILKKWISGVEPNQGVILIDNETSTSHWTTLYSSDNGAAVRPEIVITYNSSTARTVTVHIAPDLYYRTQYANHITQTNSVVSNLGVYFQQQWGMSFQVTGRTNVTLPGNTCSMGYDNRALECTSACGASHSQHHKDLFKNLEHLPNYYPSAVQAANILLAFGGFGACQSIHGMVKAPPGMNNYGIIAWPSPLDNAEVILSSGQKYYRNAVFYTRVMQHEVAHIFGAYEGYGGGSYYSKCTTGINCLMALRFLDNGSWGTNVLCDVHRNQIDASLHN